jgi:hypothetical protein
MKGDTCTRLESKYKISQASFMAWNSSLTNACNNLRTEVAYCVRVFVEAFETPRRPLSHLRSPARRQHALSGTCRNKVCITNFVLAGIVYYVVANNTAGDTCASIASTYGIIVGRFRQLNRGVNTDCSSLVTDNAYCVG